MVIKSHKMNCTVKKRYPTERMANDFAHIFNRDPFLEDEDMLSPYFCKPHDGWHVGRSTEENLLPHTKVHRLLDKIKRHEI